MSLTKLLCVAIVGMLLCGEVVLAHDNINRGYVLLKKLQDDANTGIKELDHQWDKQGALLKQNILSWKATFEDQTSLCNSRDGDLTKTNKDIETTEHYISWISSRIQENVARIQRLEEERCAANTLYINGIKNSKIALHLIHYLYHEIAKTDNLELLQTTRTMTKLTMFLEAYKSGNVMHLLESPVFTEFKNKLESKILDGEDELAGWDNEVEADEESIEHDEEVASEDEAAEASDDETEPAASDDEAAASGNESESEDEGFEDEWQSDDEEEDEDDDSSHAHYQDENDSASESEAESTDDEGEDHDSDDHEHDFEAGHSARAKYQVESGEQDVKQRTASEIGSGHIDSDRERIKLRPIGGHEGKNFGQYKTQLLDLLVEISKHIHHKMAVAQEDEVNAGVAFADYKVRIEMENEDLEKALANQQARREELLILQTKLTIRLTECKAELATVQDSLAVSIDEHKNTESQYTENRKSSVEERDIFDYVVSIYESGVQPAN